jgi:hypothetical protein
MSNTDYPALHRHLVCSIGELQQDLAGTIAGYLQLHSTSTADGALSRKVKELSITCLWRGGW